jgi:hypothetical protein
MSPAAASSASPVEDALRLRVAKSRAAALYRRLSEGRRIRSEVVDTASVGVVLVGPWPHAD